MSGEKIPTRLSKEVLRKEKWLALSRVTYRDERGKERLWEMAERTTRTGAGVDAVAMMTMIRGEPGKPTRTVLVKQYRPALDAYTLECPAGLIDDGETPEQAALRELKEETGLTATVTSTTPTIFNDPGTSASCYKYVWLDVDMQAQENQQATPAADENTEVIMVPVDELKQYLDQQSALEQEKRIVVDAGLYSFAMGLAFRN